jgi:hypothetical protein
VVCAKDDGERVDQPCLVFESLMVIEYLWAESLTSENGPYTLEVLNRNFHLCGLTIQQEESPIQ